MPIRKLFELLDSSGNSAIPWPVKYARAKD